MRQRPSESPCPPRQRDSLGVGRDLLLGAAALGLVAGLGWAGEGPICEGLDRLAPSGLVDAREAALEGYVAKRCETAACESIELVASRGCRAKVRVVERRFDAYGDEIGLFRVDEGLEFSPLLERWRKREALEVKQLLGLPAF